MLVRVTTVTVLAVEAVVLLVAHTSLGQGHHRVPVRHPVLVRHPVPVPVRHHVPVPVPAHPITGHGLDLDPDPDPDH